MKLNEWEDLYFPTDAVEFAPLDTYADIAFNDFSTFDTFEDVAMPENTFETDDQFFDRILQETNAEFMPEFLPETDDEFWARVNAEADAGIPTVATTPAPVSTDNGIDLNSIVKAVTQIGSAVAEAYFRYQRGIMPNGQPGYIPQRIPNPPPGTRYDASGRLISMTTGRPVTVNSQGQVVDEFGRVISQSGQRYDMYGRPISGGMFDNLPSWALPAIAGVAVLFLLGRNRK